MFKNIFSFSGRIRRTEYWLTGPLIWLIMIPITIISTISVVLLFFIWIIPIWIFLAAGVKRSHDLGNSGWLIFIPIYNPFFLAFGGSQPFKNKYGPNPKGINLTNNENPNIVINNIVHETPNNFKSQQTQKINEKQADTNITKNQHENQQPQNKEEIYKQLSLLHDLKEKGVITEEIYNVERQTILKKIEPTIETPQTNTPPKTEPIIEKEEIKNPAIITPPKPNVVNKPIIQNNQSTFTRRHSRIIQNKKGNNQNSNKILVIIIIILIVFILSLIGYKYYPNLGNNIGSLLGSENKIFADIPKTEMVFVKGGTFTMGCTDEQGSECNENEKPAHHVTLSDYYIGKYEVTQGLWIKVMGSNPSYFKNCGDDCPVENVSWVDCKEFISKLNLLTGKKYRLPTEAEWEYAARGGNSNKESLQQGKTGFKYAGSNEINTVAWFRTNSDVNYSTGIKLNYNRSIGTHKVGTKQANILHLFDMTGNVWEWCIDTYDNYVPDNVLGDQGDFTSNLNVNPINKNNISKYILRGGSFSDYESDCRLTYRGNNNPNENTKYFGFRLVLSKIEINQHIPDNNVELDSKKTITETTYNLGKYIVNASEENKIYFYNEPNVNTKRNAYFSSSEKVYVTKIQNGFGYIEFTNDRGQTSVGWLNLKELSFVN